MPGKNLEFGKLAEEAAVKFLDSKGYKVIGRNYRTRFGEIDIIAREDGVTCFVEVKARHSRLFGEPCEAVSTRKQGQISRCALYYLKENGLCDKPARFDVVSVIYADSLPEIELIRDAFALNS